MKTLSYLVTYKDDGKAQNLNFGPFASMTHVEEFMGKLPEPRQNGWKRFSVIQPYTMHETDLIRRLILNGREHFARA